MATEVKQFDDWRQDLTIPNFVFTEGCHVTFRAAKDAPINEPLDWIRIQINGNGVEYYLRFINNEPLSGEDFKKDAIITVQLSSASPLIKGNYPKGFGTAFFKGAGGDSITYNVFASLPSR